MIFAVSGIWASLPAGPLANDPQTAGGTLAWWLVALLTLNGIVTWVLSRGRYLVGKDGQLWRVFKEWNEYSCFLLAGTLLAQLWVHVDRESYVAANHTVLFSVAAIDLDVTFHFLVNDVFMALFFGIAAKQLIEAVVKPDGPLRGMNGFLPMMACLGGVIGPAIVYRMICTPELLSAWAVPCSTDIAFAWLGARIIWGGSHPAVTFLLAVAVADDFFGMGIIAIFYPQHPFNWNGILLLVTGVALALVVSRVSRRLPVFRNWLLFLVPAVVCWLGLFIAGLHAALALVFVVPFIPTTGRDQGLFAERQTRSRPAREEHDHDDATPESVTRQPAEATDPLNQFEQASKPVVETGLFFFGLANAGVVWIGSSAWDQNSWAVFLGLGVGKTVGIFAMTVIGYPLLRLLTLRFKSPFTIEDEHVQYVKWRDLPLIGLLGSIGFTVALFVADAAGGHDSLKLGAMASFVYLGLAVLFGKLFLPKRRRSDPPADSVGAEKSRTTESH